MSKLLAATVIATLVLIALAQGARASNVCTTESVSCAAALAAQNARLATQAAAQRRRAMTTYAARYTALAARLGAAPTAGTAAPAATQSEHAIAAYAARYTALAAKLRGWDSRASRADALRYQGWADFYASHR